MCSLPPVALFLAFAYHTPASVAFQQQSVIPNTSRFAMPWSDAVRRPDSNLVRRRGRPPSFLATAPTDTDILQDIDDEIESARIDTSTTLPRPKGQSDDDESSPSSSVLSEIPITAVALLNVVAIIWGTQHSVIKTVVDDCDASAFSFARFGLAAALVVPYLPPVLPAIKSLFMKDETILLQSDDNENGVGSSDDNLDTAAASITAWRWGVEMGLWMFLGYAFQAVGLEYTTAQRSGFLLYLNVKFVPFFSSLLFGKDISIPTWASALTALVGTALLSFDGSSAALNIGDLWSIAAAAASAMFILRLESASKNVPDSSALNAACLAVVTVASLVWTIAENYISSAAETNFVEASQMTFSSVIHTVELHPFALIYLGGITTALANYIQTKAQKDISAERASIIYAMDPVYGAIFANILLGETLNSYGMIGAGIITVAAATNAFLDFSPVQSSGSSSSK